VSVGLDGFVDDTSILIGSRHDATVMMLSVQLSARPTRLRCDRRFIVVIANNAQG